MDKNEINKLSWDNVMPWLREEQCKFDDGIRKKLPMFDEIIIKVEEERNKIQKGNAR